LKLLDISISAKKHKKPAKEPFKPRRFEDGSIEVCSPSGLRKRQQPVTCLACGEIRIDTPFTAESVLAARAELCVDCFKIEKIARAQAIAAEREQRLKESGSDAERYRLAKVLATPLWRDREKIRMIYEEARRLTIETGISHTVDHIYPIRSKYACGLHVHQNLQVLERTKNSSKGNGFPLFDSPALRDF
jgi:hypothetical protein